MNTIQIAAIMLVVSIMVSAVINYEFTINKLTKSNTALTVQLDLARSANVLLEANNVTAKGVIKDLNTAAIELGKKYDKVKTEYTTYKNQPKEVKYEVLYKYTDKKDSNECEDIKQRIDGVVNYINNRM
jgi:hypothetical protein